MRGIRKSFYGVEVLKGVDLVCPRGQVHAIVGENGAGKSTLMKVLSGVHAADAGTIRIAGRTVHFRHPRAAQQAGVSIIFQEFRLLPERSVAENIFLGREPGRRGLVDAGALDAAAAELLARLRVEHAITPRTLVRELSVAQQQMVEIAKALSFDARIVVMDEPTAALSPNEASALFECVNELQAAGLAIVYVSHRLDEVFRLAQRITVLKDGATVGEVRTSEVTHRDLIAMMVGRPLESGFRLRTPGHLAGKAGRVRLRVRGGGNARLSGIDVELRAGEILGVAGLAGSGRTELARALFGVEPFTSGAMELDGRPVAMSSPAVAIAAGMGFLTEDRKAEGLLLRESVLDNARLSLRSLRPSLRRARKVPAAAAAVEGLLSALDLRSAHRPWNTPVQYLSGGNQQKVVLAKWLATRPEVLLFDEPTRGVDVGGKAAIHEHIRDLARKGAAILMISSELSEVIAMSDRVLVMHQGCIAGELDLRERDVLESDIMLLATGAHASAPAPEAGDPTASQTSESQHAPESQQTPAWRQTPESQQTPAWRHAPESQQTPASRDAAESQQTPASRHAPESQQTPASRHAPKSRQMPASQQAPESQHAPASRQTPASQQTPASRHAAESQQTPASRHAAESQQTPASQRAPESQQTPASQRAPESQQTPASQHAPESQQTPASRQAPASQRTPASRQAPASSRWARGAATPIWVVFAILFAVASVAVSARGQPFFSVDNVRNMLVRSVALGLVAVGQSVVVLGGSIDLSVAYLISVAAVLASHIMQGQPANVAPAILLVLAMGAAVGLVNGLLVTRMRVNAFMATLGMGLLMRGVLENSFAHGTGSVPPVFQSLGYSGIGPVPYAVLLLGAMAAGAWLLVRRTRFGYHLMAVGGDEETTRVSGVRSDRVIVLAHVLCSLAAVISGLFLVSRVGSAAPWIGPDGRYDLDSIAAVVLGGTALTGGRGSVLGTVGGVLVLAVVDNALNQFGVNTFVQDVVRGVILVSAVAAYTLRRRRAS
ncbi:ATP-binding cassette domain-containing protein [Pendulispora albinea]|uniref:ATP-binding cassette domain-containing protein n=1 Tax=Pendulispora albinea TaxID=2741071 RepID=A0ABZ2M8T4_9BACT